MRKECGNLHKIGGAYDQRNIEYEATYLDIKETN